MVSHAKRWSLRSILTRLAAALLAVFAVGAGTRLLLSTALDEMFPVVETDSSQWHSPSGKHSVEAVIRDAGATTNWCLSLTMASEAWWRPDTQFLTEPRYGNSRIGISVRWLSDDDLVIHVGRDITPTQVIVHGVDVDIQP